MGQVLHGNATKTEAVRRAAEAGENIKITRKGRVIAEIVAVSEFDKISMQEGYTQKPAVLTQSTQNSASSTPAPQEKGNS